MTSTQHASPSPKNDLFVPLASGAARSRTRLGTAERIAALREVLGTPDRSVAALPQAIRRITFRMHDLHVRPLFQAHWPEALTGSIEKKLRFLTCNLYATAPYTVLLSSKHPPFAVRFARGAGVALGLDRGALAFGAGLSLRVLSAWMPMETHRRIVQIAAFIAAVDHVFDHHMRGVTAEERGVRMRGVLDGSWAPAADTPHAGAFRFLRALFVAMGSGLAGDDARVFNIAVRRLFDYVDAEVKAMTGVPDPAGCAWRLPGVLGTIDGLFSPVWRASGSSVELLERTEAVAHRQGLAKTGDLARDWMYGVSFFVQVMDDWIDLDQDEKDIRPTPVMSGAWDLDTVKDSWDATLVDLHALVRDSGITDESYLAFARETYRMMMIEVMEAMSKGSAA